jgi:hypothetical protein
MPEEVVKDKGQEGPPRTDLGELLKMYEFQVNLQCWDLFLGFFKGRRQVSLDSFVSWSVVRRVLNAGQRQAALE